MLLEHHDNVFSTLDLIDVDQLLILILVRTGVSCVFHWLQPEIEVRSI